MVLSEPNLRARLAAHEPRRRPVTAATPFAAVAAIVRYPRAHEPEVLLIRRTAKPTDPWSGHMAFPGGRQEPADPDLIATAIRETREEVGFDLRETGEHLGRLDDVQAISRARPMDLIIVPHVFLLRAPVTLSLQPSEVADAVWAPLAPMLAGEVDAVRRYERDGQAMDLPGYRVGEHIVWGLTYRMLELLFEVAQFPRRW